MDEKEIKHFVESALLAAGRPLSLQQLQGLFDGRSTPDKAEIRKALADLETDYAERGITIGEVASGFRLQIKVGMAERLHKLWEERPPRYSRALFETLALVAYRQPITRGEIEDVRGVSVSANIVRTLMEREWIRVVGHRDVPGRPAMFGTTRQFLDYFGLKKLDDLPPLTDVSDWESLRIQLDLPAVDDDDTPDEERPISADVHEIPVVPVASANESVDELDESADEPANSDNFEEFEELEVSAWPEPRGSGADDDTPDTGDDPAADDDEDVNPSVNRA